MDYDGGRCDAFTSHGLRNHGDHVHHQQEHPLREGLEQFQSKSSRRRDPFKGDANDAINDHTTSLYKAMRNGQALDE